MSTTSETSTTVGTATSIPLAEEIPDVVGLPIAEAQARLEAAGLHVLNDPGLPYCYGGYPFGVVLGQDPEAGESVVVLSEVDGLPEERTAVSLDCLP